MFNAWIDPDRLARWFGPRGVHTPRETITVEPAVGGELRLTMVDDATGAEYPALFRFTELVEPELLVFNTSTIADPHSISEQSVVTVTFADLGDDTTELTLHAVDSRRRRGGRGGSGLGQPARSPARSALVLAYISAR